MSGLPRDPEGGCKFLPGSDERIECLARRYECGYAMEHPDDNNFRPARDRGASMRLKQVRALLGRDAQSIVDYHASQGDKIFVVRDR